MMGLLRFILVTVLMLLAVQLRAVAQRQAPANGHTVRVNDIEIYYEEIRWEDNSSAVV